MKIAVVQPYLFPYIGYFQLFTATDKVILYDSFTFRKGGWINRNRILEKDKGPMFFRIPLRDASSHTPIRELQVDRSRDWKTPLMKSMIQNYRGCRYFSEVLAIADEVFTLSEKLAINYIYKSFSLVLSYIDCNTVVEYGSARFDALECDLRNTMSYVSNATPSSIKQERVERRIIQICKEEEASGFVNPVGGSRLYRHETFQSQGVHLEFIKPKPYKYPQNCKDFFPDLSIIDVLMNIGSTGTKDLIRHYSMFHGYKEISDLCQTKTSV
jgi:hypothetical protein